MRPGPGFENRGLAARFWGAHSGAHGSYVGAFYVPMGATDYHNEIIARAELQR